ncbi:unnamed protein product [Caenorhabditis auriculariae]|uniref:Galectin n=1 Tax=Caenorhabditis auriculariae TaxID=2777116 RepID=A0A8S1GU11_9PELO|nr:unnamed protein product [Caenorhabditis auriculariae]
MTFLEVVSALSLISLVYGDGLVCYGTERVPEGLEYASLERTLRIGDTITIYGYPDPAQVRLAVDLCQGDCPVWTKTPLSVHINPRFPENNLVFRSFAGDWLNNEEIAPMPIQRRSFKMEINVGADGYHLYVDGRWIYRYSHRYPYYSCVKSVLLVGIILDGPIGGCGKDHLGGIKPTDKMHVTLSKGFVQTRYAS